MYQVARGLLARGAAPGDEYGVAELMGAIAVRLQVPIRATQRRRVGERVQQLVVARAGLVRT